MLLYSETSISSRVASISLAFVVVIALIGGKAKCLDEKQEQEQQQDEYDSTQMIIDKPALRQRRPTLEAMQASIANLKAEISGFRDNNAGIKKDIQELRTSFGKLEKNQEIAIEKLEKARVNASEELGVMKKSVKILEKDLDGLKEHTEQKHNLRGVWILMGILAGILLLGVCPALVYLFIVAQQPSAGGQTSRRSASQSTSLSTSIGGNTTDRQPTMQRGGGGGGGVGFSVGSTSFSAPNGPSSQQPAKHQGLSPAFMGPGSSTGSEIVTSQQPLLFQDSAIPSEMASYTRKLASSANPRPR